MSAAAPPPHLERLASARRAIADVAAREGRYLEGNPYRLVHAQDMRAGRYTVRVDVALPLPVEIEPAVAAAVRELRQSLDDVASSAAGAPVKFPVHDSLPTFAQRARKAIARMTDEAQAAIEALQPYHAIGGYANGPLWILDQLARAELIRFAGGGLAEGAELGVNTRRKVELSGSPTITEGAFEAGAIVAAETFKIVGPDPKIDLYFRGRFELAFAGRGPARGRAVGELLGAVADHVEQVVFVALAPAAGQG